MALMGHVTPEMTLRYAKLASPTVRAAYQTAMDKVRVRQLLPLLVGPAPTVPSRVEWLRAELLKTRVAHGYCSRDLVAEACPYANICEQCDNFVTTTQFLPASRRSWPTCERSATTPRHVAGTPRWPATPPHHQHREPHATTEASRRSGDPCLTQP
jgi:hypothetical protein